MRSLAFSALALTLLACGAPDAEPAAVDGAELTSAAPRIRVTSARDGFASDVTSIVYTDAFHVRVEGVAAGAEVTLSAKTYTLIAFREIPDPKTPEGMRYANVMQRCLHCLEPACVSACPTTALYRQVDGPVSYDADKCIGCRYCMLACPWDVPTAQWDSLAPKIAMFMHAPFCVGTDYPPGSDEGVGKVVGVSSSLFFIW